MTNKDRWDLMTKNCTSPQTWLDFGYYFLVTAALQRRVWYNAPTPNESGALFPNMYICMIGRPGLGKGAVSRPVAEMLRAHKYEKGTPIKTSIGTELPLIFPMGADSVTFEQLISSICGSIRRIPLPQGGSYFHCSYAFVLEEMDSLFKTKTADVASFLKNLYDCTPYSYETRHQGVFHLRNPCLSLMAGLQPDFLYIARKNGLFGQGFASRALMLFESERRSSCFHSTELSPDQLIARSELNTWIKKLSVLYGRITYSQETYEFLEYWEKAINSVNERKAPPRMQEYFARKKVTMEKLAAGLHFGENTSLEIPLETFQKAISILDNIEEKMDIGLGGAGRNPVHNYTNKMLEYIKFKGGINEQAILIQFSSDMGIKEIRESLEMLEISGQIKKIMKGGKPFYAA